MFKFLKEKLKESISRISEKIRKEGEEEIVETSAQPSPPELKEKVEEPVKEEKGFFARLKDRFTAKKEGPSELPRSIEKDQYEGVEKAAPSLKEIKEEIKKPEVKPISLKPTPQIIQKVKEEGKQIGKQRGGGIEGEKEAKEVVKAKGELLSIIERKKEETKPPIEEAGGFFSKLKQKITTTKINEAKFDELFWDLEVGLMENNVAVGVIDKIKEDLRKDLVDKPIQRARVDETILGTLKQSLEEVLSIPSFDLIKKVKEKKPYVICFFGINGSGKTTTIAKLAKLFQLKGLSCVIAASDTFRAAAIDQLQTHADILGVKLIKHNYGSDPAAVAFDAIKHAQAKNIDIVLIDTAGRMHSNVNLLDEMKKIIRVAKPDLKIFVGEAITGNDCVEQCKEFNNAVGIDAVILAKADIDEKGGAAVSVSYVTKKPILFLGTGQSYGDLRAFDKDLIMENLGLEA